MRSRIGVTNQEQQLYLRISVRLVGKRSELMR